MNIKNFLKMAVVMTAMAMTCVMMTSCNGKEDNAVVLPEEESTDQGAFQGGNVILKAGEGQGDDIVFSPRDKTCYYGFTEDLSAVPKDQFFDDNRGLFYRLPDCPETFTAPEGKKFIRWEAEWMYGKKSYAPGDFHHITYGDVTITAIWGDVVPGGGAPGGGYDTEAFQGLADEGFFSLENSSGWQSHVYDFENIGSKENFDASMYEYAWIKFSGNTGRFCFGVTYNEWKSIEPWGESWYDNVVYIEDAEGIVYIKIEKEKIYEFGGPDHAANAYRGDTWDKHIRNIFTRDDGHEVSVTVEGIWFGTAAELKSILNEREAIEQ